MNGWVFVNKNKDKKELLVKYLENDLVELKNNEIYLDSCETIKDKIIYAKTFIHGFGKSNSKFIIAFLNCFDDKDILYLTKKPHQMIGCFTLRIKGKKSIYLYDFTILKEYRGNGYSRQVLNLIYHISLEWDKNKLFLYLKKNNERGRNLYFSEGFVKYKYKKRIH